MHLGLLIGESSQMQELYGQIKKVAATDSPVLILGETGTGKELIAEAVHRESGRRGDFVAVNCGSLSRELAGSELFGHEKGSFTGASRRHVGYFQRADRGTLFLDELTEMPIELQPHFLRVLETSRVMPVGAEQETRVEARIVAATNREPKDAIVDKCLREDLYFRLGVFPLRLPPLREREDDIALLAEHFAEELQKESVKTRKLSEAALAALKAYPWPGNVRELRHVIHRAVLFSDPDAPELELPASIESPFSSLASQERIQVGRSIRDVERELIVSTLEHFSGDKRATADMLGISLKTLYNRLNEFRLESVAD
jgi:DNA-binding NtrC family response regulator